jgi:hypothetical protein
MLAFDFIDNNKSLYILYENKNVWNFIIFILITNIGPMFYSLQFYLKCNKYFSINYWWEKCFRCVRKIVKKGILFSSWLSVRPSAWNNSAPRERIFIKQDIWVFFENLPRKIFKSHENLTRRLLTKIVENINIRFLLNNFFPENRAVHEIMWKNFVEPDRPQITLWRMRFKCWMTKATDTHL